VAPGTQPARQHRCEPAAALTPIPTDGHRDRFRLARGAGGTSYLSPAHPVPMQAQASSQRLTRGAASTAAPRSHPRR
jgi:hypothetical protein